MAKKKFTFEKMETLILTVVFVVGATAFTAALLMSAARKHFGWEPPPALEKVIDWVPYK